MQRWRRLWRRGRRWAQVRGRPDEAGRYVVWTLTPGSYDAELHRRRLERAAHDPPPMTRQRLVSLLADLTGGDDTERRSAEHDLALAAHAQHQAELGADARDERERQSWLRHREALDDHAAADTVADRRLRAPRTTDRVLLASCAA